MDKIAKLAQEIADDSSKVAIYSACPVEHIRGIVWYDVSLPYKPAARSVRQAVRYLELREVLIRHRRRRGLVRWDGDQFIRG